jgi:hypothetical protein
MAMNEKELHDFLDVEFARVVDRARQGASDMDPIAFSGIASGLLVKTAIRVAAREGCPRAALENVIARAVREHYGN